MNRRSFFSTVGVAIFGQILWPRLAARLPRLPVVWPGITDAPSRFDALIAQPLITPTWMEKEALNLFENQLTFSKNITREYDTNG